MWQRTHGSRVGAYRRTDGAELYVRLDPTGWLCFIDGVLTDRVHSESQARASLEATLRRRGMVAAGATCVAAATRKPGGRAGPR
jgi:hypothetical protein